ncbi:unnamed protein product (macronuclear) [Paramecium tetraurelia]|uniref:Cyclic nucleotide-binding domain-containing protein n=1 Tax=Paramecium tetraurelia TaxID=5888 RepID=A0BHW2_PARTE|nr:uncharacterized protein GSPATT00029165001 [Paramecium tetraurelia]CAK58129.1 unnamed protein product [Paramecium tetraurelia]|eukprot:XP_001425527.1 hypothetical protein (macronuclear) [Paramecium tetraurelia strain d4-2]
MYKKQSARPDSSKHNKLVIAVNQLIEQQEQPEQMLLKKITNLWSNKQSSEHDQNIQYQRCLYILQLEPDDRSQSQAKQVQAYFEKHFHYIGQIRGQLSPELYLKLFKNLLFERVNQFELVFNYGEKGRKMYFILEGEVGILLPQENESQTERKLDLSAIKRFDELLLHNYSNHKLVAIKKKSDHFGEIAIEQRVPRTATVVAKTECIFATLSYDAYQSVLGLLQEQIMKRKFEIIRSIPPFKNWVHTSQYVFLHNCEEHTFETNNIIYKRFNKCDSVYLIIEGEILVQKWEQYRLDSEENEVFLPQGEKMTTLGRYSNGQVVGDYEVYLTKMQQNQVKRSSQAKCMVKTSVLRVPIQQYIENMRNNQTEEWLQQYYEDKFSKKWINYESVTSLQKSASVPIKNQYILPNANQKSTHILRKISQPCTSKFIECSSNYNDNQVVTYSQDLLNLMKQNRKYRDNSQNQKNNHSVHSSYNIIQNLKNKILNYQDRFQLESRSGVQSQSIFDRKRCQSRIDVDSFQTQFLLKPSTCSQKKRTKFKSMHKFEYLSKVIKMGS